MSVKCSVCCVYLRRFLLGFRAAMRVDCSVGLPSSLLVGFESCHECGLLGGLTFVVSCWVGELP